MKKVIAIALVAAVFITINISPAFAASMEIYGETKMNLWDLYITENNAERPDAISTATVDAVTQATYNPYDNKPVAIETGVDLGLIADSLILEKYEIKNEMVDRILNIWRDGYSIRVLGTSSTETNPLTKNVVKYTADDGTVYYLSYQAVKNALSDMQDFSWEHFVRQAVQGDSVNPPYRVKYLLNNGDFGKRVLISQQSVLAPPSLTLDSDFSDKAENLGKFIQLNFGNDADWANAVYAIKVNETGLLQGNMKLGSYSDHNGDTSFITGQDAADKSKIIIRLSQKFKLGENKLTFMARGYEDAEFTLNLNESQSTYPWIVSFQGVNEDNKDAPLTRDSIVKRGDVIRVDATDTKSYFSGKFDGIFIDGKPLQKEDTLKNSHTLYYEYTNLGKKLKVYTDTLTAGLHELHLIKHGYNDEIYFFTVSGEEELAAPDFTVQGEEVKVGGNTTIGGSVKGTPVVLKSDADSLQQWSDSIRKIFFINDSTGEVNQITGSTSAVLDVAAKTVSINGGSMNYWNTSGSHTLVIRSHGYTEARIPVKRVSAMPSGSSIDYRAADGAVVVSSNYSFMSADNLQNILINGTSYPASNFDTTISYSAPSTLIIPSEYFEAGTTATVKVITKNYSDLTNTITVPEEHIKRKPAPSTSLEQSNITKNGNIVLNFTDDAEWRAAIQTVVLRSASNLDTNYKSKTIATEAGKLTVGPVTLSAGSYTLIVTANGYQPLKIPVQVVDPVPGAVTSELQPNGSVTVKVEGSVSSYISGLSVSVDGQAVSSGKITKNSPTFTLSGDCFPVRKTYQVLMRSSGYADYSFQINTDVSEPPALAVLSQMDTATKTITVTFDPNEAWRAAITGAELIRSSGTAATVTIADKSQNGSLTLSVTGSLYSDDYTLKISADGYRKAMLPIKILSPVPTDVSYDLLTVDGVPETDILLKNYSYAGALKKIKVGNTILTRGEGFTVDTSQYIAVIPGIIDESEVQITLFADNYADKTITIVNRMSPPAVTLPVQMAKDAELTFSSNDSGWASAVSGVTIDSKAFTKDKLAVTGGDVSIPADKMKNAYVSAGTGKTIKVTAAGYRTLVLKNITIYEKLASAFQQTITWNDGGSLSIDLNDTSSSYYSVSKVYVNGTETTMITKPSYSNGYKLLLSAGNFTGLSGTTVQIKITGSSSSNLPELLIDVVIP
ncbi:hemoblobin-interacting domain-containing protein [Clostridium aminobutyricum]|uniref:DUF1533 domain-containing protein n=1 Tax=Clostridium aminobutyricum TaxID=33953 RepID=A0A939II72_CLOAM|nr:hemoblobin-interacting domain-containing protein [Clostridium aminobutyricum]MBN7772273.1 DUF1533 domain-containing protein [Clostridium aminobutyricum]